MLNEKSVLALAPLYFFNIFFSKWCALILPFFPPFFYLSFFLPFIGRESFPWAPIGQGSCLASGSLVSSTYELAPPFHQVAAISPFLMTCHRATLPGWRAPPFNNFSSPPPLFFLFFSSSSRLGETGLASPNGLRPSKLGAICPRQIFQISSWDNPLFHYRCPSKPPRPPRENGISHLAIALQLWNFIKLLPWYDWVSSKLCCKVGHLPTLPGLSFGVAAASSILRDLVINFSFLHKDFLFPWGIRVFWIWSLASMISDIRRAEGWPNA